MACASLEPLQKSKAGLPKVNHDHDDDDDVDDDDDDDDDDVYTKDRKPDRQRDKVAFPIQRLTTIEKQRVFNRICLNFC